MLSVEITYTLIILVVTLVLLILDRWSSDVVSLICLTTLMLTGILTPKEGFAGFSDPVTITIAALFVLSAGLQYSGALDGIGHWLAGLMTRSFNRALALLILITGVLSAFINNTAVVAVFIPVVMQACRKARVSPSRALMPLSFAAMLAGSALSWEPLRIWS